MDNKAKGYLVAFSLLLSGVLLLSGGPASAATFVVNSRGDDGSATGCEIGATCTLRGAINAANDPAAPCNATGTCHVIEFDIDGVVAGVAPAVIQPSSPLPEIRRPVTIDGFSPQMLARGVSQNTNSTSSGLNAKLGIELNGTSVTGAARGLVLDLQSLGSVVRGLVINNFAFIGIEIKNEGGNRIEGNFIGPDVMGDFDLQTGNGNGITILNSRDNVIGGSERSARNLISLNEEEGIDILGAGSTGNRIEGNLIGTDVDGLSDLGNGDNGILLSSVTGDESYAHDNTIGGILPELRNVISGNGTGVQIFRGSNNRIFGNLIGVDVTGEVDLGNSLYGVQLSEASENIVGVNDDRFSGNIISGNGISGIGIFSGFSSQFGLPEDAASNEIGGNYIGLSESGNIAIPNGFNGIALASNDEAESEVIGNFIGDVTSENIEGGNFISGNGGPGIFLNGVNTTANFIRRNFIGLGGDKIAAIGNETHGILISGGINNYLGANLSFDPGYQQELDGNEIAYNGGGRDDPSGGVSYNGAGLGLFGHGVVVDSGTGNSIRLNKIYFNEGRGIDLGNDSFTINDVAIVESQQSEGEPAIGSVVFDQDDGANGLQNFPVAIRVDYDRRNVGEKRVTWVLQSKPETVYQMDFYFNSEPDPSGFGEGEAYLFTVEGTTDATGKVLFELPFQIEWDFISATATEISPTGLQGSTSEFSMVDTDTDSLADAWEMDDSAALQMGIDINEDSKIDLALNRLPKSDWEHKNIYVEVDGMVDRLPDNSATGQVKIAFREAPSYLVNNPDDLPGIDIVFLDGGDVIEPARWIVSGNDFEQFDLLKDGPGGPGNDFKRGLFGTPLERADAENWPNIRAAKALVFRYFFAADKVRGDRSDELTEIRGTGELGSGLGGNDFYTALGFRPLPIEHAAVIMHELGHLLGLGHGGTRDDLISDDINYKPNYRSVMNYTWSEPREWMNEDIDASERIDGYELDYNGNMEPDYIWELDYSRFNLNPLNEAGLSESEGIGPPLEPGELRRWVIKGPTPPNGPNPPLPSGQFAFENGPVDWDGDFAFRDGVIEPGTNNTIEGKPEISEVLLGREDWSRLKFYFWDSPGFAEGLHGEPVEQLTLRDSLGLSSIGVTPGFLSVVNPIRDSLEAGSQMTIYVARGGGTEGTVSVDFATVPGTATETLDFVASSGTLVFTEGEFLKQVSISIVPDGTNEGDETFGLVLSNPTGGARFLENDSTVATITIIDDDGPGAFVFPSRSFEVDEKGGLATIDVIRTGGSDGAASVQYYTSNDTAVAGEDYLSTSGTLNFSAGQTSTSFAIPILEDVVTELTERVDIHLVNPTGGSELGLQDLVYLNIVDVPVTSGVVEFGAASYDVLEDQLSATITVVRSESTDGTISVDYAANDESAFAGSDYAATSGTLNFADGEASQSFDVPILDDGDTEGLETLGLALSNASTGAGLGSQQQASLRIIDDEGAGAIQFASASYDVTEGTVTASIEVIRLGDSSAVATINYASIDGTALAGADYTTVSDTLNFAAGQTTASFDVPILDDADAELAESLSLTLSGVTGGAIAGANLAASLLIADDDQVIEVVNTNDDGDGSLRWAISRANDDPERELIAFNIPGSGVHVIRPNRPFPRVLTPVIIDGYTQPGSAPNTSPTSTNARLMVQLDGAFVVAVENGSDQGGIFDASARALEFKDSTNSIVRGLVFSRWKDEAIELEEGSGSIRIVGNFIGTDPTGTFTYVNQGVGILIRGVNDNVVGGILPADRNIVGGSFVNSRQLAQTGISIGGSGNRVIGNLIGVAANGASPLGNYTGVSAGPGNTIGGTGPGEGNIIAFNRTGASANGATIRGNSFFDNGEFVAAIGGAIKFGKAINSRGSAGPLSSQTSFNDPDETDGIQNFPILSAVNVSAGTTTVEGRLNSTPNNTFALDFYSSPGFNALGFGEGKDYLGAHSVVTGPDGKVDFAFVVPLELVRDIAVTATATNQDGATSEFSARILVGSAPTAPFVVNASDDRDDGRCDAMHCSLREAILASNNAAGPDTIEFAIESGPQAIRPRFNYPPLMDSVLVDGDTQPGFAGQPLVSLSGEFDGQNSNQVGSDGRAVYGLQLYGGASTVRGMVINSFIGAGITTEFAGGNRFVGNFIGTDAQGGSSAEPTTNIAPTANGNGIFLNTADDIVGGTNVIDRNVISGNAAGIWVSREGSGTQIQGNYIGPDATGMNAIVMTDGPISENPVQLDTIRQIGGGGIRIEGPDVTVGGLVIGAGNVISGNGGGGVLVDNPSPQFPGATIQGNLIGTTADGDAPLGNATTGIFVAADGVQIGGTQTIARNVISDNKLFGVVLLTPGNKVEGNYIGTDSAGTEDLGNGRDGIVVADNNNSVGGVTAGAGNLISGNDRAGILLIPDPQGTAIGSGNEIKGNLIGTTADGLGRLGNGEGIIVGDNVNFPFEQDPLNPGGFVAGPVDSTIGGTEGGAGNVIAYNDGNGISLIGSRIAISSNAIYANGGLGIDLANDGVTANDDGDADMGPLLPGVPPFPPGVPIPPELQGAVANDLQNFPVISSANLTGGSIAVSGSLNSLPMTTYRLEFFSNAAADDSGNGEGRRYLGELTVTTDGAGDVNFSPNFPAQVGQIITATATDPTGNTSEFSAAPAISGASNVSPVADNDQAVTEEGTPVAIPVLANDVDPDGDLDLTTVAVVSGPVQGAANVDAVTGIVTYVPVAVYVGGDSFSYTVKDTAGALSNEATVNITVVPRPNQIPVADAGPDQSVFTGETATLDGSGSNDPEGEAITYAWAITSRPSASSAALTSAGIFAPTLTPDLRGDYVVQLTVNDGEDDSLPNTVTVQFLNTPPVADAGADQSVLAGETVNLDGSNSSDADDDPLIYRWYITSAPAGSNANISDTRAESPTIMLDLEGSYGLELLVNDGFKYSEAATVTLTAAGGNNPPVADAGPDQDAAVGDTVMLDGSGSTDPDQDSLTFNWTLLSAPAGSAASLSDAAAIAPTIDIDKKGSYDIQLVVNDSQEDSLPDMVLVTVSNTPPVADAGADQFINLNDIVVLDGSGSTDADGDSLTYSWTIVDKPASSTATLSDGAAVMPTLTIDAVGVYTLQLVVNDGEADSDPDQVVLETFNVAPVADAGPDQSVVIGQVANLDGSNSSDLDGDPVFYTWTVIDRPAGSVSDLSNPTVPMPTIEIDAFGTFTIQLVVSDGMDDSAPDTVVLNVVNTAPIADAGPDQNVFVGETAILDGTGSSDVDGDALDFSWSLISQPTNSAAVLFDETSASPSILIDEQGIYVVQLIVNDGEVDSDPDTVVLNVDNIRPVADAGPDQVVGLSSTVTLDGSDSTDADNDPLTYFWSALNVPAGSSATLSDPVAVMPTIDVDVEGDYILQLIVNDGIMDSDPDTMIIIAEDLGPTDSDGDLVSDDVDICPGTSIPESAPTSNKGLGKNRWALQNSDGIFTQAPPQSGRKFSFTTSDTGGCSCEQIVEAAGLGLGHLRHGCSTSALLNWIGGF